MRFMKDDGDFYSVKESDACVNIELLSIIYF